MPSERARVIALLDQLQAAERAGANALGSWLAGCGDPGLRAGLRVIRARDRSHAALAEGRLRALGGVPAAEPNATLQALCGLLAAPELGDRSKIATVLARFPGDVHDPFSGVIGQIENDGETRALLETIGDDERASLAWLREEKDADQRAPADPGCGAEPVLRFVDALRAAEAAAAEVFTAWIGVCALGGLRGGLRTIAAREATHATLLTERVHELGGAPRAELRPALHNAALARFASRDVPDEAKLALVLARHPDDASAAGPLLAVAEAAGDDAATRTLLRLIAAGEAATLGWLRAYHTAVVERQPPRAAGAE